MKEEQHRRSSGLDRAQAHKKINYLRKRSTEDKVQKLNPEKNHRNSEANVITQRQVHTALKNLSVVFSSNQCCLMLPKKLYSGFGFGFFFKLPIKTVNVKCF